MAARTLTYTINMAAPAKALHAGLNVVPFNFNSGTTKLGTLSDMVLLGKIPNGALVVDGDLRFGAQSSAASTWTMLLLCTEANGSLSTWATLESTGSMTAGAAAAVYRLATPTKVSLSDDRAVQFVTLALNCTVGATETVSFSFQGNVKFLSDGSNI